MFFKRRTLTLKGSTLTLKGEGLTCPSIEVTRNTPPKVRDAETVGVGSIIRVDDELLLVTAVTLSHTMS